ncbi:siphovirus Gp157 family protein [bacterium]|nr:siphovirus Gp157 family protein [bacterium]MDA8752429.1 siphovirus Gp157 family protein [bacterium]
MKNIITLILLLIPIASHSSEIQFGFKSPSFSGVGTGSHYLTIENQETSRKNAIKDALEAAQKAAEREAENTTLAKFIRNLESRIYAQLSKQLVDNMFSNEDAVTFGSFTLEGSVVSYQVMTDDSGEDYIQMRIIDTEGTETILEIPIGTGNFGSTDSSETDAAI